MFLLSQFNPLHPPPIFWLQTIDCPAGGTLRIYADSLKPNIPYKTILLSTTDMADFAVVEALEKYGLEKENPREYCIARVPDAKHFHHQHTHETKHNNRQTIMCQNVGLGLSLYHVLPFIVQARVGS